MSSASNTNTQADDQGYDCEWAEFPTRQRREREDSADDHQSILLREGEQWSKVRGCLKLYRHTCLSYLTNEYSVVEERCWF